MSGYGDPLVRLSGGRRLRMSADTIAEVDALLPRLSRSINLGGGRLITRAAGLVHLALLGRGAGHTLPQSDAQLRESIGLSLAIYKNQK